MLIETAPATKCFDRKLYISKTLPRRKANICFQNNGKFTDLTSPSGTPSHFLRNSGICPFVRITVAGTVQEYLFSFYIHWQRLSTFEVPL